MTITLNFYIIVNKIYLNINITNALEIMKIVLAKQNSSLNK